MSELDIYERIDNKIDKLHESLYSISARLTAIETDLKYHIARTDMLETQFKLLDKDVTKLKGFFSIGGWVVGIIATILTLLAKIGIV